MLEATLVSADPTTRVHVVALDDPATPEDAAEIGRRLGAKVHLDAAGAEQLRFGARTSGQVLVYDADGRLALAGGLTPARGHQGPNPGAAALAALLTEGKSAMQDADWPVFGCSLTDDAAPAGRRP